MKSRHGSGSARVATLVEAMARINALPIMKKLPPGVTQPPYVQAADMAELFGSFGSAMRAPMAIALSSRPAMPGRQALVFINVARS